MRNTSSVLYFRGHVNHIPSIDHPNLVANHPRHFSEIFSKERLNKTFRTWILENGGGVKTTVKLESVCLNNLIAISWYENGDHHLSRSLRYSVSRLLQESDS